jgi:serine/threonine protein kinase
VLNESSLKPENVVIDEMGYIKLADFGLSKIQEAQKCSNKKLCGTPEYFAPEMVAKLGYGCSVDWWALGCMAYELRSGFSPIDPNPNTEELYHSILHDKINMPKPFSDHFKTFLRGLLNKNPEERMAFVKNIKSHPWLAPIDWGALQAKKMVPPSGRQALKSTNSFEDMKPDLVNLVFPSNLPFPFSVAYDDFFIEFTQNKFENFRAS